MHADKRRLWISLFVCLHPWLLTAASFRVGVARVEITPHVPIWMAGYGDRTHPSTGIVHPLWAKVLAIQDSHGGRLVIVTTDLSGLQRSITDLVAARAQKEYGRERSALWL